VVLEVAEGVKVGGVEVKGRECSFGQEGKKVVVKLKESVVVGKGEAVEVKIAWG
jgi:hypothetical protein